MVDPQAPGSHLECSARLDGVAVTEEHAMSAGGLSKARLGRMHAVMAGHVEDGEAPGIVTLVSRRGEVHVDAIGTKAVGGSAPIRRDTIFRITSMTKPITAAATMILVEESCGWTSRWIGCCPSWPTARS